MSDYLGDFLHDIKVFNDTFDMPKYDGLNNNRLEQFLDILREEIEEWYDIKDTVGLADWLGDIIVYCASELVRSGIDPSVVVGIIMDSNFSKLDRDQNPIYDDRDKLLKGPDFQPPEPMIAQYLTHYGIGEDGLDQRYTFRDNSETSGCEQEATGTSKESTERT